MTGSRSSLLVAVAAAITLAAALALDGSTGTASGVREGSSPPVSSPSEVGHGTTSIMRFTPAQLVAGALGGYALPETDRPTVESVLSSMTPQTRSYTERVTA